MTGKEPALCSALMLLLCAAGSTADAAESNTWDTVRRIRSGEDIRVETADRKVRGSLLNVSESGIALNTGAGEVTFERGDVARVFVRGKSHRLRNSLIGAAVGGGAGIAVASTLGVLIANESGESIAGMAFWVSTGVGGAVGAAIPTGGFRKIYDSRQQ